MASRTRSKIASSARAWRAERPVLIAVLYMFACLYSPSASQASLLALASSFSPLVEDTAPGMVIFSIVGLSKLIGTAEYRRGVARIGAEAKIQGNLAIAADPDAAVSPRATSAALR